MFSEVYVMNIGFCGLKENICIGREAIKTVRKEFPDGFHSCSYYEMFDPAPAKSVLSQYEKEIEQARNIINYRKRLGISKYEAVEYAVKETGAANCGEQAILVSKVLNEKNIPNKVISMNIYKKNTKYSTGGHTFCVVGLDDNAETKNPATWGKDAAVIDMWSGIVSGVRDALTTFQKMFKINKEKSDVIFMDEFF